MIHVEREQMREHFPRRPFVVRHGLASHGLLSAEALLALGRTLPAASIEYNAGDLPVSQDAASTPRNGLSIEETIRRIRECRSWMVLKNVEQDAGYARLLNECVDVVGGAAHGLVGPLRQREGFVFLSSPGSVTPYHMDPEHNFLLQIEGTKRVFLWDADDREVLQEAALERFYGDAGHRNMPFNPDWQSRAREFVLHPGDALYFPPTAPHWVQNGPEVSVSFSITFRSPALDRRQRVYWVNHRLRSAGLTPAPFGRHPLVDSAKHWSVAAAGRARRLLS